MAKETTRGTRRAGAIGQSITDRSQRETSREPKSRATSERVPPGRTRVRATGPSSRSGSSARSEAGMGATTQRGTSSPAQAHRRGVGTRATVVPLSAQAPREVPRAEWLEFLDDFSTRRDGWLTTIEIAPPGGAPRVEAHGLPLDGVSIDIKAGEDTTSVVAGKDPADHITHLIPRTRRIMLRSGTELKIEAADGTQTTVRCKKPEKL